MLSNLVKLPGARSPAPEALQAAIAAAEQEAREARAESGRLAAVAAVELDDRKAEAMLTQSRAEDRAARRAEARIPELREKLADALWTAKEQALQRYKKQLSTAARKAIAAFEAAAEANIALAAIKQAAGAELGAHASLVPTVIYTGLCLPDLIATWRRHTERALDSLDKMQLPRPPKPAAPGAQPQQPQQPQPLGIDGPVVLGAPTRPRAPANGNANRPAAVPAAPAPAPAPKREPRRDGPPGPGERQIHFLAAGGFSLPDGRDARAGDYVNLAADGAQEFVKRGVANFVDVQPAEKVAQLRHSPDTSAPAAVEGVFAAAIELPFSAGGSR